MSETNFPNFDNLSPEAQENLQNRVMRVFISSTFNDMQRERNYLTQVVFPRFKKECKACDVEFVPIDLRWGVTDEQSKQGKTVGICLNEIRRSRSFFIGLLGERYGWKPRKEEIYQRDFQNFDFLEKDVDSGLSVTEIEIQFGVLREESHMDAGFWFRSSKTKAPVKNQEDVASEKKLNALKELLYTQRKQKEYPVSEYDSPEDLGKQIEEALIKQLNIYFPRDQRLAWLQLQNVAQDAFERSRTRFYVENQDDYDALNKFVSSEDQTLAVVGASGLGKSALLAKWKKDCAAKFPNVTFVSHYVSASENSDQPGNILRRLTESLEPNVTSGNESQSDLTSGQKTLEDFTNEFTSAVAQYLRDNPQKRLLFIIDGLNQLSETDDAKELCWLSRLPDRAQYILSTVTSNVDSDKTLDAIKRRNWKCYEIKALNEKRRIKIIKDFLDKRGKNLTPTQEKKISEFPLASNPLVLKTLLDEVCLFGSHEELNAEIDRYVDVSTVNEFFAKVFERLERNEQFIETDPKKRKAIVEKLALLLAVSRFGLNEEELCRVAELPLLTVSTFLGALDAQLVNRSGLYSFAHDYICKAVLTRYAAKIPEMRRLLITRFLKLEPQDERRLREVPFQYLQLESWKELRLFLLDFDVLEKLYDMTFNCDFCLYWNAAARNVRKEFKFAAYLQIPDSDNSSGWYSLAYVAKAYGDFSTAEKAYTKWLRILRELAKETPVEYAPYIATTLNNLGLLYDTINRFSEAEEAFEEALEIFEELSKVSPDGYVQNVAQTSNNFASHCQRTNRFSDAETLYRKALNLYRELEKENPVIHTPNVAKGLNNLATLYRDVNSLDSAEKELEKATLLFRELAKENPNGYIPDVANSLLNLAEIHQKLNRLDDAEEEFQEAVTLFRELAEENPIAYKSRVATALNAQGLFHKDAGRLDKAEIELQEALKIRRELFKTNPNAFKQYVATTLNNLGLLHTRTNNPVLAEKEYKEAFELFRDLTKENPKAYEQYVAFVLNNLGLLHCNLRRLPEAKTEFKKALDLYRKLMKESPGAYKLEFAKTSVNSGAVLRDLQQFSEAEENILEGLAIYREAAQKNPDACNPSVAMTLNNLAALHRLTSRYQEEETELQEALELYREAVRKNPDAYRKDLAMTLNGLAVLYCDTDRFPESLDKYEEAFDIYNELAEKDPCAYKLYVAVTLINMSNLYANTKQFEYARMLISGAISICEEFTKVSPVYAEYLKIALAVLEDINRNS